MRLKHVIAALAISLAVSAAAATEPAPGAQAGSLRFVNAEVTDPSFGGMRVCSLSIPAGWRMQSQVRWDFGSANYPVHVRLRVDSPDGKTWVEFFPYEAVFAMQPPDPQLRRGARAFGALYIPGGQSGVSSLTGTQALQQLLVQPVRNTQPGFRIVSARPISDTQLARAFQRPDLHGEAATMRVQYTVGGSPVEEDFYALFKATTTIPYNGPQGSSYEYHRQLLLAHAFGAAQGLLASAYPLLTRIAVSIKPDEQFNTHVTQVQRQLAQQNEAALQRGYANIAAAGQLSRNISANNDAMLANMQRQRSAQQHSDSVRRTAANAPATRTNDDFSDYLRGTTRMSDPYWGESAQDSNYRYHWTDSAGNYRASNDAGFNPNVGAGGGPTWQRMEGR